VNESPAALSRRSLFTAAGALLLAGCGSNGENTPTGIEVPEPRLGLLAVTDVAPMYVAQRQGIFSRDGLRPRMVESELTGDQRFDLEGGGKEDIHFDSWVTIFLNIADGGDWMLLGEAYQMSPNTTGLITSRNAKLRSVPDLKGTRIAVNNLSGLGVMLINALLAVHGLSPRDVRYVETPFDKIGEAVVRGDAETGWLVEPYLTVAQLETGAVPFADTASGATLDLPQSGYVCARSFAKRNPRTIKAFQNALISAQIQAQDRSRVERELVDNLKVSDSVAALMNIGNYPSSLRAIRPQRLADLMLEQGMLKKKINVADLVLET
jgi:NitT/TauT family transport system substrate-binding protein